jgi:hypothetical protein
MNAVTATRHVRRWWIAPIVLLLLSGCGDKSPTEPAPAAVVALTLVPGTDFLKVGQTTDFRIEATYSDGRREVMPATNWGSDNPTAVTVSGGHITAVAPGLATIFGECQHGRATRALRIAPDYEGTWSGAYYWRTCTATGELEREGGCVLMPVGIEAPMTLHLAQDRERVTGRLVLGELAGDVTGTLDTAGHLAIGTTLRYQEEDMVITIVVGSWDSRLEGGQMLGSFRLVWTILGLSGDITVECDLRNLHRGGAGIAPMRVSPFTPSSDPGGRGAAIRRRLGIGR